MGDQTACIVHRDDLSADEKAVIDVLRREIAAFAARDFAAFADCYLHSDRLRTVMMSHDLGIDVRRGWEAHADGLRLHFEGAEPEPATFRKEIEQIEVVGDCAWVVARASTDSSLCQMDGTFETWVLERHEGAWKAVCNTVLSERRFSRIEDRIAVDAEGRLIAPTDRARRRLADHPSFEARQGRFRAVNSEVDRDLQAAIGRAGALHGYFEQTTYANMEGQRFACPIVLELPDDGGHEVVMLTVEDRLTYVDLGAPAATTARVDVAATIFGLSEAQTRIAHGIVGGRGLPDVAADMGITAATARTHLQRAFQKTGTASQTALVRCLLSVG